MSGASAIRSEGLRKAFGPLQVLGGIDLDVASHEVVCLIGASGSGKSTLLRCLNLLEPIDAGRILLAGHEVAGPEAKLSRAEVNGVRRRVGIVFQAFNLFPHMSGLRNVTIAPLEVLKQPRGEAVARA
ncbi:MAG TPA: ATP-binding cassette domain-containing protein, partial [Candidatus Limnocylindrales bacterium]